MTLKPIRIGWNWLERTLNGAIDAVNANHILPSSTIAVQETPTGTILTVTLPQAQTQAQGNGGGGLTLPEGIDLRLINLVDEHCNQYTMYVLGTAPQLVTPE